MGGSNGAQSKLAYAMQNAALESINEDIKGIYDSIEKIINELPKEVKIQLSSLTEEIASLEAALKVVPEQYDLDFSRKMNRLLDVVSEIDLHSQKLNKTIQDDNSTLINSQAKKFANEFNRRLEGFSMISTSTIITFGLACSVLGGVISGVIAWVVLPQLF